MGSLKSPRNAGDNGIFHAEEILWVLSGVCQLYRLPFDPQLATASCSPPFTQETLLRLLSDIGFKAGAQKISLKKLSQAPMPVIGFARKAAEDMAHAYQPVLIVRVHAEAVLFFRPGAQNPETLKPEEAQQIFSPDFLLISYAKPEDSGIDPEFRFQLASSKKFGFHGSSRNCSNTRKSGAKSCSPP